MPDALTSIIVLMWNSRAVAPAAIESALGQTVRPLEVLVLDNASTDGTAEEVSRRFGDALRLVRFERNLGYTGGYNRGLLEAKGESLLFLNPDVRLAADFLAEALTGFQDPRVGIVAGRLVRPDGGTVDSTGQFLGRSRRTLDRGYGQPFDPARDAAGAVLSASGAAALYRRAMIRDISDGADFLDADYFAFHEDLEIGWRAWRAGWKAVHVPRAVAVHLRAGGATPLRPGLALRRSGEVAAHVVRNRYLAMLRHDQPGALLADLPFVLARDLALWSMIFLRRPKTLAALWRTRSAFARAWRKRRADRRRAGQWGAWRRTVPPRGLWPVHRTGGSHS